MVQNQNRFLSQFLRRLLALILSHCEFLYCSFCNVNKIPLLDARTTAEYKLYQGRLYVNCTTFPSS